MALLSLEVVGWGCFFVSKRVICFAYCNSCPEGSLSWCVSVLQLILSGHLMFSYFIIVLCLEYSVCLGVDLTQTALGQRKFWAVPCRNGSPDVLWFDLANLLSQSCLTVYYPTLHSCSYASILPINSPDPPTDPPPLPWT